MKGRECETKEGETDVIQNRHDDRMKMVVLGSDPLTKKILMAQLNTLYATGPLPTEDERYSCMRACSLCMRACSL